MKKGKQSVLFLGLICMFACAAEPRRGPEQSSGAPALPSQSSASSQVAASPSPSSGGVHKLALLVGINNYKYSDRISPLGGSINDIEEMRQLLIGKFEFPSENVLVLKDAQATHV